jgi:F0F1-type ATP synthase alpha subunit
MVDVDSIYGPSNYMRASDLPPRPVAYLIEDVEVRTFDGVQKLVLTFRGERKRLVLNKTNAAALAALYGRDSELWKGKEVTLVKRLVAASDGQQVMAIRVVRPGSGVGGGEGVHVREEPAGGKIS